MVFERDDCRDGRRRTIRPPEEEDKDEGGADGEILTGMSDGVAELQHSFQSCGTGNNKHELDKKRLTSGAASRVHQRDSPSSVSVWLEETPSVSVTTTEYLPRSSLSGLVKVSLELRNKVQMLETHIHCVAVVGLARTHWSAPPPAYVLPFAVTDTRGQSPIGL